MSQYKQYIPRLNRISDEEQHIWYYEYEIDYDEINDNPKNKFESVNDWPEKIKVKIEFPDEREIK